MISQRELDRYRRYGVAYPIRVLDTDEAERFRSATEALERALGGAPRTIEVRQMHLHFRWAYELATAPRVLDAVQALMGPNLMIWATELFAKPANDPNLFIAWHRDRPYMGFDGEVVTAWISLARSFEENGCLQLTLEEDRARVRETGASKRTPKDSSSVHSVVLEPGEMSLHDADVHHGSERNRSGEKRVGFAIRFITPATRPRTGRPRVLVVRGADTSNRFEHAEAPSEQSATLALQGMRGSAARHMDAMLENLKHR